MPRTPALDGRLAGVIDFGQLAAGDPACDLTVTWTMLSGEARRHFQRFLNLDEGVWIRARGQLAEESLLWKALLERQASSTMPFAHS